LLKNPQLKMSKSYCIQNSLILISWFWQEKCFCEVASVANAFPAQFLPSMFLSIGLKEPAAVPIQEYLQHRSFKSRF